MKKNKYSTGRTTGQPMPRILPPIGKTKDDWATLVTKKAQDLLGPGYMAVLEQQIHINIDSPSEGQPLAYFRHRILTNTGDTFEIAMYMNRTTQEVMVGTVDEIPDPKAPISQNYKYSNSEWSAICNGVKAAAASKNN